jgi:hypothetical protein
MHATETERFFQLDLQQKHCSNPDWSLHGHRRPKYPPSQLFSSSIQDIPSPLPLFAAASAFCCSWHTTAAAAAAAGGSRPQQQQQQHLPALAGM